MADITDQICRTDEQIMHLYPATPMRHMGQTLPAHGVKRSEFRLVRYFSIAAFAAFLTVATVLYVLEQREIEYFRQVQQSQKDFVAQVQENLAHEQEITARRDLLIVHEAGHVNMTKLLANALWTTHVAPLVSKAEKISTEHCHPLGRHTVPANATVPPTVATDCLTAVGEKIATLAEFAALDARVAGTIRTSTVFKVKVFDRRGITVYSSEHAQIGEDKYNNQGWRMAAGGHAASELTHRDKFSAFEGMVENRDLISSYVPVRNTDGSSVVGVFEIYSDVTPFLVQIKNAAAQIAERATANQAKLEQVAAENQQRVEATSRQLLLTVGVLLLILYMVLLLIVRHAQRILNAQAQAQALFIQREERWHHEKMSALSAMAANVAHEIGNPLATISALAESIAADEQASGTPGGTSAMILEQTQRIAAKTRQITDFAVARGETSEPVDVNQMVKAVCDFLAFERSFRTTTIQFQAGAELPARVIVPDHLTESLMNLLQMHVESTADNLPARNLMTVKTLVRADDVVIQIACNAIAAHELADRVAADPRMAATRRRIFAMGGQLRSTGIAMEISLPPA